METKDLREPVRRNMVTNNLPLLNLLAVGHNLVNAIRYSDRSRLLRKTDDFLDAYNRLIDELNKMETPTEDQIMALEEKIKQLENGN